MASNTKIIRPKVSKIKCLSITKRKGQRFEGRRLKEWHSTKNSLAMNCKFRLQRHR